MTIFIWKVVNPNQLKATKRGLQHLYDKHAKDWGMTANRNNQSLQEFWSNLAGHIENPNTWVLHGHYRGNPAVHFLDPQSYRFVSTGYSGQLLGTGRLTPGSKQFNRFFLDYWLW